MDKKSRSIEVLLAFLAVALIVISLLLYLQFAPFFESHVGPCWNDFILPVITNIVSTLAAIAVSLLLIRRLLPDRTEEEDIRLANLIDGRVRSTVEHTVQTQMEAAHITLHTEIRNITSLCAQEIASLLAQSDGNQLNNLRPQSLNKRTPVSGNEESIGPIGEDDSSAPVSRKRTNKKARI